MPIEAIVLRFIPRYVIRSSYDIRTCVLDDFVIYPRINLKTISVNLGQAVDRN